MTTIKLKNGSGAPTAGDLAQGEPALDLTNKRLYTEDSGGTVIEVGTNPGTDVTFADNRKAIFGAGSDLQIYHDGSHSYVSDQGTGNLRIYANDLVLANNDGSETFLYGVNGGAVSISYANSAKVTTTATGIDVTGTVTADGLTVDGDGATVASVNATTGTGVVGLKVNNTGGNTFLGISNSAGGGYLSSIGNYATALVTESATNLALGTNNAKRLLIGSGGDISFYEDTGTTAKLFWDASAESLGIGTTSIGSSTKLQIAGRGLFTDGLPDPADGSPAGVAIGYNTASDYGFIQAIQTGVANKDLYLQPSGSNNVIIANSGGNVGINQSNPTRKLHVTSAGSGVVATFGDSLANNTIEVTRTTTNASYIGLSATSAVGGIIAGPTFTFSTCNSGGGAVTERMRIDSSGNVGIGTSNIGARLTLGDASSTDSTNLIRSYRGAGTSTYAVFGDNGGGAMVEHVGGGSVFFKTSNTERMRIDASGNVGIGTSSPSSYQANADDLVVATSGHTGITIASGTSHLGNIHFADGTTGDDAYRGFIQYDHTSNYMRFATNASEAMRLDSSQNLLVGTTDTTLYNNTTGGGAMLSNSGCGFAKETSGAGDPVAYFNNTGDDGQILDFRKDGTTVGNIVTAFGYMAVGTDDTGISFRNDLDSINPFTITGNTNRDAAIDLGASGTRFKDLYLSGGAYLGGTGSANHLDDYEEGTWTPDWQATTTTVTVNHASYVKIGKMVTVNFYIANISPATSGDVQYITGLPFTNGSGTHYPAGVIAYSDTADVSNLGVIGLGGDSKIYFHYLDGTSGAALTRNNWNSIKSSGLTLIISMTYEAA